MGWGKGGKRPLVLGTEDYIIFWASVRGTQYAKKFSLALAQQHDAPPSNLLLARRWGWGRVGVTPVFFSFSLGARGLCATRCYGKIFPAFAHQQNATPSGLLLAGLAVWVVWCGGIVWM